MDYNISRSFEREEYDDGLRDYMVSVYRNMGLGLLLTTIFAYAVSTSPMLISLFVNPISSFLLLIFMVAIAMQLSTNLMRMTYENARALFFLYSAFMGLSLSVFFVAYTGVSIVRAFLVSASVFGVMCIYGQTTKRDLTDLASFFIMGLVGLLISSVVNLFLRSSTMDFAISIVGVMLFTLITAYDNQNIKRMYYMLQGNKGFVDKVAIYGAFQLYLDFINLFVYLLRFIGVSRRND